MGTGGTGTGSGGTDEKPETPDENGGGIVGVVPGGGGGGGGGPVEPPLVGRLTGLGAGGDVAGTRAAAVAGVMLGVLALASGLVWALYKLKPGVIPLGGAAAAGRAGPATAPLLDATGTGAPGSGTAPGGGAATEATAPAANDVGTMTAAGYSSLKTGASGGGAYSRGFGVVDTSQTVTTRTETLVGGGGAGSPTSTMNRGIQTDVADGSVSGGLGAAGGAASSTFMQSTMTKNVYSTQQMDSSFSDGLVAISRSPVCFDGRG